MDIVRHNWNEMIVYRIDAGYLDMDRIMDHYIQLPYSDLGVIHVENPGDVVRVTVNHATDKIVVGFRPTYQSTNDVEGYSVSPPLLEFECELSTLLAYVESEDVQRLIIRDIV